MLSELSVGAATPYPKIAEIMNRTVGGIAFKAHKLKVSLRSRNQDKCENFVRRSISSVTCRGRYGRSSNLDTRPSSPMRQLNEQHIDTAGHQAADEPDQRCAEKNTFATHRQILAQPNPMDIDP